MSEWRCFNHKFIEKSLQWMNDINNKEENSSVLGKVLWMIYISL